MAITDLKVREHRSLGEVHLEPGALTALVGPNGSGKTTLLRAVERLVATDTHPTVHTSGMTFRIREEESELELESNTVTRPTAFYLRLDPSELERPSGLPGREPLLVTRGQRLAGAVTQLILEQPDVVDAIGVDLRAIVPSFAKVRSRPANGEFELRFDFVSRADVPQGQVSSGTLAALAILVLVHAQPARETSPVVALIDDPETGLHPGAQVELIRKLRAVAEGGACQVLLATHSPYVVDAAGVENTWVLGARADGRSVAKRLTDHPEAQSLRVLTAGEFWGAVGEQWVAGAA